MFMHNVNTLYYVGHCACQWGHDFRPDYTKLGILKQHFPNVPLIAVTATASNKVREDCCRILRLGTNYQFFRSSANRPNLNYSVKVKPEGQDKVVKDMSDFIQEHHKNHSGIIYTFSKKDANTVADKLNQSGITARPYHSDISASAKDSIHRSWMRNKTQVVVATIAFGLGMATFQSLFPFILYWSPHIHFFFLLLRNLG